MKTNIFKKIGVSVLVSTMVLPAMGPLVSNPISVKAFKDSSGVDYTLTTVARDAKITAELEDYYNHLGSMTEVAYSQPLKDKGNAIIAEIDKFLNPAEGTEPLNVNENKDKIKELWMEFGQLIALITEDDFELLSQNYDMFDKIYYSLYKLTDMIENLDDRATIQLTACKEIFYQSLKNQYNGYINNYGSLFLSYNNIPEIKYSFYALKDSAANIAHEINSIQGVGEDGKGDGETDINGPQQKIDDLMDAYKNYNINENVGMKDSDVDIPEDIDDENASGGDVVENPKDENQDDESIWDNISDFIDNIINNITGNGESNAVINSDVNYTNYEYDNGCYKVVKTYDENGKLLGTKKVKGTTNSDLLYCSIAKTSVRKYPETPNISKYSIKPSSEYKEESAVVVYTMNKTLENPLYYRTNIEIKDGAISYDDAVDLLKQVISKGNGSFVQDGDKTMFMLEGQIFVIDKSMKFNKEKFEEISDKFNYVFIGFVSVDEEAAQEEENGSERTLSIDVETLDVNGKTIENANIYIKNEQFMVPVKSVVEAVGGTVEEDDDGNIIATIKGTEYNINEGSNYIYSKDKTFTLLNKNETSGGELYADMQSLLESLGMKYNFNKVNKTLYIK